ncbi:juvenile hormone epoxide hydrolase-like protein 5 precursor [Tribolium castaneum]|uniref:Epoxide hydrolase n=1 Tax=Tribolium castaneum TaxID=7070 RepID=D0W015_TRICA|nr:juvenile hormone epoxide hydrolase-like protein 5 precursor [Tribolium castaneum]BAI49690.1 juvenile hormone epoxide hydrolase-like protein 5 [Tribolium castaneum]|eukprot:NP_001161902.1 juvenile hormone epoxide hydrolase-like protein 5 precursor [Tribolium castaneum]
MGLIIKLVLVIITVLTAYQISKLFETPPVPKLENTWWGPRDPSKEDTAIKPFKINVSDEILKDLQHRLANARPLVPPLEGAQQHYGMNTKLLGKIIDHWRTKYNWREREKFLNQYPQFTVSVQGLRLHYIHVKPPSPGNLKVLPLLLLHGWPGSVREFYDIIPLLTKPAQGRNFVFEVIVPSLPGYGFSEAAVRPGLGPIEMSVVFKNFMKRIGFDKYYIQGGDWGALIVQNMATLFPEHVLGVHSNMCFVNTPLSNLKLLLGSLYPPLIVSKEMESKIYPLSAFYSNVLLEFGYMHLQATKPDTVGVALNDSPVGLAAYILEKFTTWTNADWKDLEDGGLTKKYKLDDLLDNVMIYWVSNSITTSVRLYSEAFNKAQLSLGVERIPLKVPSACAVFRNEIAHQPPALLSEKYHNLVHYSEKSDGGHFAAFEVPKILAEDIFVGVEKMIAANSPKK